MERSAKVKLPCGEEGEEASAKEAALALAEECARARDTALAEVLLKEGVRARLRGAQPECAAPPPSAGASSAPRPS